MRMTERQYIEERAPARRRPKRITRMEAQGIINRIIKRQAVANGYLDPKKPKFIWSWEHENVGGKVEGNSKSDARGEIKKALGIAQKDRLPVGIKIEKVGPNPGASLPVAAVIKSR